MGFWNSKKRCRKAGTSARPATAPLMVSMPYISVAKPSRIVPVSFRLLLGAEEEEHDANEGQNRREGGGLEQLNAAGFGL